MLPERLSNHLCSLRPGVDRLTYSVLMEVTAEGNVRSYRIVPAIIRSARRFSYEEVQKILDAGRGEFHWLAQWGSPLGFLSADRACHLR